MIGGPARACLVLCTAASLAAAGPSSAAADPVLARLMRIARGHWATRPVPAVASHPYAGEIATAARRHGLSPSLLTALVRTESAFDPFAVSRKGARGLGQLMPATARELGVENPFDPRANLDGSARYLARQYRRFGDVRLALAAYHAGPERARRGLGHIPRETRSYIDRVLGFEREYRRAGLP